VQLQSEATAVMESVHALQSLVDSMCDRDRETAWIRGVHKYSQLHTIVNADPLPAVSEFIAAVNANIFSKSCKWVPSLERQTAAAAAKAACVRPIESTGPTPIIPTPPPPSQQHPAPPRPSTAGGYTRFRQVPLGSGGEQSTSGGAKPQQQLLSSTSSTPSSTVVKLAPLNTILSLDNKQWLTLTRNGSVTLRDLIDGNCVPWPTNCLLRICDEIGLPRDVVLKVRASHIPKSMQSNHGSRSVPSDVRAAIVSYLKILQRRWHPDRFHHALGGGATTSATNRQTSSTESAGINLYAPQPSDEDDEGNAGEVGGGGSRASNAVLAQATLVAQSINAIRDAMGEI
jgi:hypothetical protein